MKVTACAGRDDMAVVYIAEYPGGRMVEFSEALQPPLPRDKKWVVMLSTLYGCPVHCPMCDAGGHYLGRLSVRDLFFQIDYLVHKRYPDNRIPVEKFKIQFARMGEPSFNTNVMEVLRQLPSRYDAPGLLPCLSTIAPVGSDDFFAGLIDIKKSLYPNNFQLQFSIHTTDPEIRDRLIPMLKWKFDRIADYGRRFYNPGGRKITLNCALIKDVPVDPEIMRQYFDPDIFLIKLTPLNPTYHAAQNGLDSETIPVAVEKSFGLIEKLRTSGFEVILSIGELDENVIGSNCGQYILNHLRGKMELKDSYQYPLQDCP
jgi:23S rRNA (adenine2503-C2)-methyltransferase